MSARATISKTAAARAALPFARLHPSECLTLEETAQCLGVSRERVRQIENVALAKCAARLAERGLTVDDLLRDVSQHSGVVGRRIFRSE